MSAADFQVHFKQDISMEANIMNPDQTAPLSAVQQVNVYFEDDN